MMGLPLRAPAPRRAALRLPAVPCSKEVMNMARGFGVTDIHVRPIMGTPISHQPKRELSCPTGKKVTEEPIGPPCNRSTVRLRAAQSMTETKELRPVSVE